MENNQSTNTFGQKVENITLKGYYKRLPLRSAPRNDFIKHVAQECHVTIQTVRKLDFVWHKASTAMPY